MYKDLWIVSIVETTVLLKHRHFSSERSHVIIIEYYYMKWGSELADTFFNHPPFSLGCSKLKFCFSFNRLHHKNLPSLPVKKTHLPGKNKHEW